MNRLYWLDDVTLRWYLVMESADEKLIMRESATRIHSSPHGLVGYAKYVIRSSGGDLTYWSSYTRYEGGSKRANAIVENVPKPIRLMEMLQ